MANDIQVSLTGISAVKNGTIVVSAMKTGRYFTINTYALNVPTMSTIQAKFDDRFDDPSYYYGIGGSGIIGT